MGVRQLLLLGVVLLTAPIALASAQDSDRLAVPRRGPDPVFQSGTDLVVLPLTVTDARQKYVTGLTMADFQVYEDGILQDLAFFAADPVPLDLAILLDTSASMQGRLAMAQDAAVGFVRSLRAGDRASVIEFSDAARVRQPLVADLARVESAIRETTTGGGTALYTALYIALKELTRQSTTSGEVRRQAIVLLSDGDDTRSLITSDDVVELVRRSGIVIYTISIRAGLGAPGGHTATSGHRSSTRSWFESESDYLMRMLAEETGGRAFFPIGIEELTPVYGLIAEELAQQYTLGYSPKNPRLDGAFRRIAVRLPSQPGARPRTRLGYLASGARRADGRR
ncbi:MAG: VWA domain-containing protein [Acidobacteria bacterium]|nr:VWA domain-containing protein [Acidobacteriota bacterium]